MAPMATAPIGLTKPQEAEIATAPAEQAVAGHRRVGLAVGGPHHASIEARQPAPGRQQRAGRDRADPEVGRVEPARPALKPNQPKRQDQGPQDHHRHVVAGDRVGPCRSC